MNELPVKEAQKYLDELDQALSSDPRYRNSGEEFLARMEWEIRRQTGDARRAVELALGSWLEGDDPGRVIAALDLIGRLKVVQHRERVRSLYKALEAGASRWPPQWAPLARKVLTDLERT